MNKVGNYYEEITIQHVRLILSRRVRRYKLGIKRFLGALRRSNKQQLSEKIRLPIANHIRAIFGHVARLPDNTPAHQDMLRQVELSVGRPPDPSWKRTRGRPRTKWTDQLRRDNNTVPIATLWRQAIGRGHSRATLRSEPTTR